MIVDRKSPKSEVSEVAVNEVQQIPTAVEQPAQAAPAAPIVVSQDSMTQLVAMMAKQMQIFAAREARLNAQEEELEAQRKAKRDRYKENGRESDKAHLLFQAKCRHLKGGKTRKANAVEDYAIGVHTYPDGTSIIRCLVCRMKWRPGDTKEAVIRDGFIYKNHTKKGWNEAMEMALKSSNTFSNSEISAGFLPKVKVALNNPQGGEAVEIDSTPIGVAEVE